MKLSLLTFLSLTALLFSITASEGQTQESESSNRFDRSVSIQDSQLFLIVNVRIASRDAGMLKEVVLKEGDKVDAGSHIATLDRELYNAEYEAARRELAIASEESQNDIDLRYARVSEEVNRKILDRSRRANNQYSKAVSKTELEQLKLELERSKLSGEQAERTEAVKKLTVELKREQVNVAEIRLNNRNINSPAKGIVTQVYRQPGEWVQSGEPIARIIGLEKLRVVCRCELADASPSEIGKRVMFYPKDGDGMKAVMGTISFVSPEIEPVNQDFEVWAEIDNANGRLLPGFDGSLEIELKDRQP